MSPFDPYRKSAPGQWCVWLCTIATGRSFGRSDASRITTSVRGDVIDFASRNTDIH
jgi:hypothetical protein